MLSQNKMKSQKEVGAASTQKTFSISYFTFDRQSRREIVVLLHRKAVADHIMYIVRD
jgi:hypothetical protein